MNLDDALQTFVIESRELLEAMEDALLKVEQAPDDVDLINAIFRAAHTIKGSAGLFGLDHVVAFTHNAENVLDQVRAGKLAISAKLVALFFDVCDHMNVLIDRVAEGDESSPEIHSQSQQLISQLKSLSGQRIESEDNTDIPIPRDCAVIREDGNHGDGVATDNWHISLRFGPDILRSGMDPIAFIRYLTTFGRIVTIVTLTDAIPRASEFDPETCYLGFEISYQSAADKATIEDAFEFVRDDTLIRILPPHSKIDEYRNFIEGMPDEDLRLGEILVRCGTLTQAELDAALKIQAETQCVGQAKRCIGEVLVEQNVVRPAVLEAALQKQKLTKDGKSSDGGLIRVNADTLDEHINLIGELIIASAGINLSALKSGIPELLEAASVMNRLVENVRDSALQLRMVQIGATFNKFQRVVRDVSKEIGKDIHLEISGAETELDKTVVEKIGDPLTHLVRNSMDHGIESAEVREARGKPVQGTLRLNAYHDSGSIVIEVSDDGGGLDKQRILTKAIERGLIKPDHALSDQEIYKLIFEPGFSTADKVNNLSGRGVGMDVVQRNISALRGSIVIHSIAGVGTTMSIRLPLTLAIIDGFLVGVGASSFVMPLDMVVECVELSDKEISAAQGRDHLNLRGEVLPFIRLKQLFDIADPPPPKTGHGDNEIFGPEATEAAIDASVELPATENLLIDDELAFLLEPVMRQNVVVVHYAGHRVGLVVDKLMGEYQTVIRPLGQIFNGIAGISGFTILGSGCVALILDVPGRVRRVADREGRRNARASRHILIE